VLGLKGPRKMTLVIPTMNSDGERIDSMPTSVAKTLATYNLC
jgi:hypothetical protein